MKMTVLEALKMESGDGVLNAVLTGDANTPIGVFASFIGSPLDPIFDEIGEDQFLLSSIEYYAGRSANKQISPLYRRMLEANVDTAFPQTTSLSLGNIIKRKFEKKWITAFNSLIRHEVNIEEDHYEYTTLTGDKTNTETRDFVITDDSKTGTKMTTTRNDGVSGFNSPAYVDDTTSTNIVTGSGDDNTHHNTKEDKGSGTEKAQYSDVVSKRGRNLPIQDIIEKDLYMREKHNFLEIVYKDIDSVLTKPLYL